MLDKHLRGEKKKGEFCRITTEFHLQFAPPVFLFNSKFIIKTHFEKLGTNSPYSCVCPEHNSHQKSSLL